MPYWSKPTGSLGGEIRIDDNGSTVTFMVRSNSAGTWVGSLDWNGYIGGASVGGSPGYRGPDWLVLWSGVVSSSATVGFTIQATGTSGLGGPTSISATISRGSVPPPPTAGRNDGVTGSSFRHHFSNQGDGGRPITGYTTQISLSKTFSSIYRSVSHSGTPVTFTGLPKGTLFYVRTFAHNALGTSGPSGVTSVRTATNPPAPKIIGADQLSQTGFRFRFSSAGDGGMPILRWEVGYGTNPNSPQTIITSNGTSTLSGLEPGSTVYVWARGVNGVGNGAWSIRSTVKVVAGARIKVDGVWKDAVPYVKVGGVWKMARPYVKSAGAWKASG